MREYIGSIMMAIGLGIIIIPFLISTGFNSSVTDIYPILLTVGLVIGNLGLFIQVITSVENDALHEKGEVKDGS